MVLKEDDVKPTVAVIGDSTFIHGGIPGLIDVVYNKGWVTLLLLDNSATGMTGLQDHPGTGKTLLKEETKALDYEQVCRAIGIERIRTVDAYELTEIEEALSEEIQAREPSVIIVRRPCTLLPGIKRQRPFFVEQEKCTGCQICTKLMCSAILLDESAPLEGKKKGFKSKINPDFCTGCSICAQVCPTKAIQRIPR